ncbi:flagellar hook-length control protein FliK [Massilia varians]|uniref:flagellar hook-length control protein FliK n=1 Tax=Massilia varians TaxID=457921 RepID=UPI002554B8E6|nr:flagellar hook-length control protein FliK [Massilia varians]MDK6079315.1 flagellar hook-length control protein FliK [Massilia varians]
MRGADQLSVLPLAATQPVAAATHERTAAAATLLRGASLPLPSGADAAPVSLSAAARLLAGVLGAAQAAPSAAAASRAAPLLPAASGDAIVLAAALRHAVDSSGLFYESHVVEWAQGQRTLAELGAEPQQQAAAEGTRQSPTDPATAQFINMQLAVQEQAQFCWQGKLWPGQALELGLRRETREGSEEQAGAVEDVAWHGRLRLRFPHLGELDVRLSLTRNGLQMQLATGDAASAEVLRQHTSRLSLSLEAAGVPLSGLDIRGTVGE